MQLAFCLYKFFPFGGMQRDFLRIAQACQALGHAIRVYVLEWQGEVPDGFEVVHVPVRAVLNHHRYRKYTDWVQADLARRDVRKATVLRNGDTLDIYIDRARIGDVLSAPLMFDLAVPLVVDSVMADGLNAARKGYVDDVIEPAESRKMLAAALEVLSAKRDTRLPRKHANLPM